MKKTLCMLIAMVIASPLFAGETYKRCKVVKITNEQIEVKIKGKAKTFKITEDTIVFRKNGKIIKEPEKYPFKFAQIVTDDTGEIALRIRPLKLNGGVEIPENWDVKKEASKSEEQSLLVRAFSGPEKTLNPSLCEGWGSYAFIPYLIQYMKNQKYYQFVNESKGIGMFTGTFRARNSSEKITPGFFKGGANFVAVALFEENNYSK